MEDTHKPFSIPQSTIDWLLDSQTPSIRYFTYKNLLNRPDEEAMVRSTRTQITHAEYIKAIIAEQDPGGFWYNPKHYYGPKYRSSHWAMLLLTELGIPPETDAMQKGADFMLRRMEDDRNLYFSIGTYDNNDQSGFCCFWGNWLRYQIYCGKTDHPLVQQVIEIVCEDVQRKGRCKYNDNLPCVWGVIRSLFGLALIPENRRSRKMQQAITRGTSFILDEFKLEEANYPNAGKVHPLWFKLNFPLFYQADILFTLRLLAELGMLQKSGSQKALEWLERKRRKDGIWRGSSPYKSRTHPFINGTDTPNHWVTLYALSVLAAANKAA